jgi:predicted GNAT family N-acyltransferase
LEHSSIFLAGQELRKEGLQLADTTVKQATGSKEMELVYSIRTKVFIEEQQVPKDLEMDEWEEKSVHFLAWLGDVPVGTCRLRFIDHDTGKAERVAVLKEYRKTGAGTKLMQALETFARQKGAKKISLNAQVSALPFYEKLGYTAFGTPFEDAGILHMRMEKNL